MHRKFTRRTFLKTAAVAAGTAAMDWTGLSALAATIKDKRRFPVVVIGAGLGGLVSAAYLAKSGFDVTVIEQQGIPGGYATTFDRGDFTFDVSLHATVAEHGMPQRILTELTLWDRLSVAYTPELKRLVTDRFDLTLPARDPDGVVRVLSDAFPAEARGITAFYGEMRQVVEELWDGRHGSDTMMAKLTDLTLAQWMDRHVRSSDVRTCLSAFTGYYGLPPEKISALFYAIATGEYLIRGGQYYKTRSQDLSDTLASGVEHTGGQIRYNTRAERILFSKAAKVTGVRDSTGKVHRAAAVIANCPVPALIRSMLPAETVPAAFRKETERRTPSLSSFIVWLGLNRPPDRVSNYEIDLYGTFAHLDALEAVDRAGIGITIYDNLYKGYSARGTTMTLSVLSSYAPWKPFESDYFKGDKDAYHARKQALAEQVIRRVETRLIPGLSGMVDVMEIGTPLTNIFYTGNTCGAVYGYDRSLPALGSRTPVRGVYLAGAWAHGGGYTPAMIGGRDTARCLLEDFRSGRTA